jgi:hypothetical protein
MFDIDRSEGDDGHGALRAESMKRFPNRVPSAKDFGLGDWDWRKDFIPDDLVRLYEYKTELFWHNIAQGIRTNQRIPSAVYLNSMISEFHFIDDQQLEMFLFAGQQVAYERELDAMTDEELMEHMNIQQEMSEVFDDPDGLGGVFEEIIERVRRESEEREELEKLWKEGD